MGTLVKRLTEPRPSTVRQLWRRSIFSGAFVLAIGLVVARSLLGFSWPWLVVLAVMYPMVGWIGMTRLVRRAQRRAAPTPTETLPAMEKVRTEGRITRRLPFPPLARAATEEGSDTRAGTPTQPQALKAWSLPVPASR